MDFLGLLGEKPMMPTPPKVGPFWPAPVAPLEALGLFGFCEALGLFGSTGGALGSTGGVGADGLKPLFPPLGPPPSIADPPSGTPKKPPPTQATTTSGSKPSSS